MKLIELYKNYSDEIDKIRIPNIVIYNPLKYCFGSFCDYLCLTKSSEIKNVFIGINPSINGMCQTGIPFGDLVFVRDYLKIETKIDYSLLDDVQKPKIKGDSYTKREISGKRLWGVVSSRYQRDEFFKNNIVLNYCPLCFIQDGKNVTPDKLEKTYSKLVLEISNRHVVPIINEINPKCIVGIGNFTYELFDDLYKDRTPSMTIKKLTHPSPLNPRASNGGFEREMNTIFSELENNN